MEDYSQFPIMSIDEGLARVGNRKPLFAKLLGTFIANPREGDLVTAVENKDIDASVMAAHTIKGVAANLSFVRLNKVCADLEAAFKKAKETGDLSVFDVTDLESAKNIIRETLDEVKAVIETLK